MRKLKIRFYYLAKKTEKVRAHFTIAVLLLIGGLLAIFGNDPHTKLASLIAVLWALAKMHEQKMIEVGKDFKKSNFYKKLKSTE